MKPNQQSARILSIAALAIAILPACSVLDWFAGKTSDAEVTELDNQLAASTKQTAYDGSIRTFGKMLDAYNIKPIRVQSKVIANQTAEKELPDNVSNLLISAVNKIGNRVVYIPYDPSYVLNEANTGGQINRTLPDVVLAGGITEFDKDMIEKGRSLELEGSVSKGDYGSKFNHDGGGGYEAESALSRMTLDLQLLNYTTQAYLPNMQSISTVNLRKTKLGWNLGYYFQGCGLGFKYSLAQNQGKYHALRLLVELSAVEVLGKYLQVPYWRCFQDMQPDKIMLEKIKDEFEALDPTQQNTFIQRFLSFHGRNPDSATQAMADLKCSDTSARFVKLWETVPLDRPKNKPANLTPEPPKATPVAQPAVAPETPSIEEQKILRYNSAVEQGDNLYKAGRLADALQAYRDANATLPDQQDPIIMIQRISQEIAAAQSAKNNPPTNPTSEPTKKKEKPLDFKNADW